MKKAKHYKILKKIFSHIKVGKEIVTSGDTEIEKNNFYQHQNPIFLEDVDIEKIIYYRYGKIYKYFISYLYDDNKIKPLHTMLPKTSAYVKGYDGQTKWTKFLIEDDDLLEKNNTIWDKVSANIKKEFVYLSTCLSNLSTIKFFRKPKQNLTVMKLQIFTIKKFLRWTLISLDSALNKDEKLLFSSFPKRM